MARDEQRARRLDQPLDRSRVARPAVDPDLFGRASERIARFIGSWNFIAWMTLFVFGWVAWNVFGPADLRFDEWPFIGLTLLLSLQASYAAPLILLAQNRQTDRDRVQFADDRSRTDRLIADADYLSREVAALRTAIGEVATRDFIRAEMRELLEELAEQMDRDREEAGDASWRPSDGEVAD